MRGRHVYVLAIRIADRAGPRHGLERIEAQRHRPAAYAERAAFATRSCAAEA